jgi:hypothetical protein
MRHPLDGSARPSTSIARMLVRLFPGVTTAP